MVPAMKTDSGFTVFELMIVVLITAVILAAGVPRMTQLVLDNRLISQTNEFITAMSMARNEAVRRNQSVILCRINDETAATPACGTGTGWRDGWSIFVDANNDGAFTAGEFIVLMHGKLGPETTLTVNQAAVTNLVRYTAMGTIIGIPPAATTFTLLDQRGAPKGQRQICVTMTGRANAC